MRRPWTAWCVPCRLSCQRYRSGVNETPRSTSANLAARTMRKPSPAAGTVAASGSVISTSLFGSAPWSPPPLTVEVTAQVQARLQGVGQLPLRAVEDPLLQAGRGLRGRRGVGPARERCGAVALVGDVQ